ncbi:hypothetical protein [Amycolatopsis rifamycinica]|uniref:Uncharacterized protein n=1 Tax=Amycolatopsis rifamycinica TaxID=287986 RepID=A0A066U0B4_9PSEU|nr:hypothetical protein [Amycolatopsis rifamycinica]KDN19287.1 hypothetical protein DV20_26905 [Amycolatopsis rifamycinica]
MRTGVLLRWPAHPLIVAAAAVLLLNDHVLKPAWPGFVTGKLSDVAGLVAAPPVLALLLGLFLADRAGAAAAVLLTGAGFAWVKLTATGADAASAAWSVVNGPSVILADPSDLVALPALGLSWWAWRRVAAAPPLPERLVFRVRVLVATPFAVLAITATSAPSETLPSVDSVRIEGTQVVVEANGGSYGSTSGLDGWRFLSEVPSAESAPRRPRVEACAPESAAHCYRVHGAGVIDNMDSHGGRMLGVDETTDAGRTWHTAWEVPAVRWLFVERQHPFPASVTRVSELASTEIAVRAVPGGHQVIVVNGVEGLTVRDAGGAWHRIPFVVPGKGLDIRPVPLTAFGRAIGDDVGTAGLLTLLALLIGTTVAAGRVRARNGRGLLAALPIGGFLVAAIPLSGFVAFFGSDAGQSTGLWLVTSLCLVGVGIALILVPRPLRRSRMPAVAAAAVLTGLASAGPALGWTLGHPQEHGTAVVLGLVLAAVSLPVVVAAGWWAGALDPPRLEEPPWPPMPGAR